MNDREIKAAAHKPGVQYPRPGESAQSAIRLHG
jgi:hypothetical protein